MTKETSGQLLVQEGTRRQKEETTHNKDANLLVSESPQVFATLCASENGKIMADRLALRSRRSQTLGFIAQAPGF